MPGRHLLLSVGLLAIAASSAPLARPASSQDPPAAPPDNVSLFLDQILVRGNHRYIMTGTLGEEAVGLNLTVRDSTDIIAGHFYYGRDLIDIPLQIEVRGQDITMREPGSGVFSVRLFGNPGEAPPSPSTMGWACSAPMPRATMSGACNSVSASS
jgi:hypothetical protein